MSHLDDLSRSIALMYINKGDDFPLERQSLPFTITERVTTLSKNTFTDINWNLLENNLYYIKVKTTFWIHNLGKNVDCSHLDLDDEKLTIHFRTFAHLATQHPQSFAPLYNSPFNQLHEVKQGEMALTQPKADKPALATWHLAWCIAFIAYDKIHQVGLLAHIDQWTDPADFYRQVKEAFRSSISEQVTLDYILLGGATEMDIGNIKVAGEEASDNQFQFCCIDEITISGLEYIFSLDSTWGVSMRLARSVVLDTSLQDPLQHLLSYEPHINRDSSIHQRAFTLEEKNSFEQNRAAKKVLEISYNNIGGSTGEE